MEQLLPILIALACPIGMGLCMWMMGRHMKSSRAEATGDDSAEQEGAERKQRRQGASRV